jgi:predicted nucleic acid-binding protein
VIVVDSSSLVKYLLREEGWQQIEQYLVQGVVTLDYSRKEVLNAIWKHYVVRRVIDRKQAEELRRAFESLIDAKIIIIEEEERYIEKAFDIALTNQLTIYDALYVSQALRWGKLLTSDKLQGEVARKIGIEVIYIY